MDLDVLAQTESLFALANGHVGWRGNLDEGEPHRLPGSYLSGVYEFSPLPFAERGYGYPECDEVMINVTNGKLIRLLVDDEPFDVRYGKLAVHERVLDFQTGLLHRRVEWSSPAGKAVKVTSTRIVSLCQRSLAAICYEVEAVDQPISLVVQSELVANESLPSSSADPRASAVLVAPWTSESHVSSSARAMLMHRTKQSDLLMAVGMDHVIDGPASTEVHAQSAADLARVTVMVSLEPGERLRLVKFVAHGWSSLRSRPAMHDQVDAALASARRIGWEGLLKEQRSYLDDFWEHADIEVDGDAALQQAARFSLFHVLQAGARAEGRAIPAKGLTGPGYDGHAFWDTETFVLPVLTYTMPTAAAHALTWRHSTLPLATERATLLGLKGAVFPWRTISGVACSGYWPASVAAFHVNADIADAIVRYVDATADDAFAKNIGLEILVQTARMWHSLGYRDQSGGFRIDGVTGPDEYSAVADNNVYTNLMAQHNLRAAAEAVERYPSEAEKLDVGVGETSAWRDAAQDMILPFDEVLGVHSQAEGFTSHDVWDFAATTPAQYPLLMHFPYFDLYRKQVIKQSDLVLAMHLRGDAFTAQQKSANFAYYEPLTVRDSSLSGCTQAVIAAEVGHLGLAYDYLFEAALLDLDDFEHNTRDGLHIAALAGTWIALVCGLAGMRERGHSLSFSARLPDGLNRIAFGLLFRGRKLRVEVTPEMTRYHLEGSPLEVFDHGAVVKLTADGPVDCPFPPGIQSLPLTAAPTQPAGRAPLHRHVKRDATTRRHHHDR